MPEPQKHTSSPWHVPVALEDVPEEGLHIEIAADTDTRAAVAKIAELRDLPRLQADFEVTRHGADGLRVTGRVSATVGQTCVVTLEPLTNEVVEQIDLLFVLPTAKSEVEEKEEELTANEDETEPLVGGSIDLGALATEFLVLGLDPYPRKPGAVFQPLQHAASGDSPFAALAALKKDGNAP